MHLAALFGQFDLLLTLAKTAPVSLGILINAMRALYAGLIDVRRFVRFGNRAAAGVAKIIGTLLQAVADRNTVVENKTLAVPATFRWWYVFEILQDAAFEVEDVFDAFGLEIG